MAIDCCRGCVPPKRNPYCHSNCPEYAEQKARHEEERAKAFYKLEIDSGLTGQALKGVNRAYKARRKAKGR